MAEDSPYADRPRQVTVGAWIVGGCSAAMLITIGTLITKVRTVEFRDSLAGFVRKESAGGISVSLSDALSIARIGLMVLGAVSAAMLVFAFFAARRDRSARIAMTVLALPMLVGGIFVDPFLAGFVVAATVLLWTGPSADWFAGRAPRVATAPAGRALPSLAAPPPTGSTVDLATLPPPAAPGPPAYVPRVESGGTRPGRLVAAVVITAVGSLVMGGLMGLTAIVVQTDAGRRELERVLADNPGSNQGDLTLAQLATACTVVAAGLALWALVALVLAGLALSGRQWARYGLVVSSGFAAALSLPGLLAFPGFVVVTAAAALTVVLLLHPDVSAWYAGRPRPDRPARPPGVRPPSQPW